MAVYDKITGSDMSTDGGRCCFNKMCLNCLSCKQVEETMNTTEEMYVCNNKNVLETGRKKIFDAVPDGFEISLLELSPMKLKNPTKKCPNYAFDANKIIDFIMLESFAPETTVKENEK